MTSNWSVADTLAPRCNSLTSLPLSANQLHAGATARPLKKKKKNTVGGVRGGEGERAKPGRSHAERDGSREDEELEEEEEGGFALCQPRAHSTRRQKALFTGRFPWRRSPSRAPSSQKEAGRIVTEGGSLRSHSQVLHPPPPFRWGGLRRVEWLALSTLIWSLARNNKLIFLSRRRVSKRTRFLDVFSCFFAPL